MAQDNVFQADPVFDVLAVDLSLGHSGDWTVPGVRPRTL